MKLWAMLRRSTQDGWVMVESSDKTWSTAQWNGKPLQNSCLENPMHPVWKGKKIGHWTMNPQVSRCPICYWRRVEKYSRKNEETEPKQKQHPVVDVTGDGSKVQCCKEQFCIGTWNIRSMNQGELEVVKQDMATVKNNIWGMSTKCQPTKMDWNGWI